jgi:hypothetical protein
VTSVDVVPGTILPDVPGPRLIDDSGEQELRKVARSALDRAKTEQTSTDARLPESHELVGVTCRAWNELANSHRLEYLVQLQSDATAAEGEAADRSLQHDKQALTRVRELVRRAEHLRLGVTQVTPADGGGLSVQPEVSRAVATALEVLQWVEDDLARHHALTHPRRRKGPPAELYRTTMLQELTCIWLRHGWSPHVARGSVFVTVAQAMCGLFGLTQPMIPTIKAAVEKGTEIHRDPRAGIVPPRPRVSNSTFD